MCLKKSIFLVILLSLISFPFVSATRPPAQGSGDYGEGFNQEQAQSPLGNYESEADFIKAVQSGEANPDEFNAGLQAGIVKPSELGTTAATRYINEIGNAGKLNELNIEDPAIRDAMYGAFSSANSQTVIKNNRDTFNSFVAKEGGDMSISQIPEGTAITMNIDTITLKSEKSEVNIDLGYESFV